MKIQIGVNQKMKLYNVYRLCKIHVNFFSRTNAERTRNNVYTVSNWMQSKKELEIIRKIPMLKKYVDEYIELVPDILTKKDSFEIDDDTYAKLNSQRTILYNKMLSIIELYESFNIEESKNCIDIKLPPCDDLKEYISYLKNIDFIFSQCPFLQCENEIIKFQSVDVGSNWIKLAVATTTTCMILNNTASLLDKALILKSHYMTIQQQEEMLRRNQLKNELTQEQLDVFKQLKTTGMDIVIKQLEKEYGELPNSEERDKAERSLDTLVLILEKGGEIYASIDAPEETQLLFPEIQGNLELSDNIIKYLEDKTEDIK